jgi:hypothetical protein
MSPGEPVNFKKFTTTANHSPNPFNRIYPPVDLPGLVNFLGVRVLRAISSVLGKNTARNTGFRGLRTTRDIKVWLEVIYNQGMPSARKGMTERRELFLDYAVNKTEVRMGRRHGEFCLKTTVIWIVSGLGCQWTSSATSSPPTVCPDS